MNLQLFMLKIKHFFIFLKIIWEDRNVIIDWLKNKGWENKPLTVENIVNYLGALWKKTADQADNFNHAQAAWRMSQIAEKSPECLKRGNCIHCGCVIEDKVYEDDGCTYGCYPPWMSSEEFQKLEKINNGNF